MLLKRGIAATLEELLLSAEYIMAGGNYDVILCERGIRTFETYTRNTHGHLGDPDHSQAFASADDRRSFARHGSCATKLRPWRGRRWRPAPTRC